MMRITKELPANDQEQIAQRILECYNRVVTEKETGYVKLESYDLMFVLAVNLKTSRFQASLVTLSDCRFPEGGSIEIPVEPIYAASFDFLEGMNSKVNDTLLTTTNEAAVRVVNDTLGRIFEKLTSILISQLGKV